ncbi:MAG TPA: DEAD/DEAH box helicase family protein [Anaerolineae bacterium]|jgi:superfamily II DNA or RNA helicase
MIEVAKAGKVKIAPNNSPTTLKWHQTDAIKALNSSITPHSAFAGLLVMPTGAGKTFTAAYWLLQNILNHHKKLLWIAHRHELLAQALRTFVANASAELLPNRQDFQYRIISGLAEHDQPVNIQPADDLIVASKDSLQQRGLNYLLERWTGGQDEIFLVIDEAHHATAKTYRFIIDSLSRHIPRLKILGLTATPIRTSGNLPDPRSQPFARPRLGTGIFAA